VNVASLNRHIFKVVVGVEVGEDVEMKLVVDSAECILAGLVHRCALSLRAQGQATARQSPKEAMAGCPYHSTPMRG